GAPKCGTTSLAGWLGQHPEVFVPELKEPAFFGEDLTRPRRRRTQADYLDLYAGWTTEPYALDASTASFYSHTAAEEIAATAPEAKVLIALRNPVEASYSLYHQQIYNGMEPAKTFEEALSAQEARRANLSPLKVGIRESRVYTQVYALQENVTRYVDRFGHSQVRIVLMDDIRQAPERTFAEVCDWVGLSREPLSSMSFTARNTAKRARWTWLGALASGPPAWAGRLTAPFLSRDQRLRIRNAVARLNARPATNPPIRPETRARLAEVFEPEVLWLSEFLDRDLSHWLHTE
ncbi:MAG: sulfotransferase domain-containing protein, partial [Pseudomonadota bacterium]